MERTGILGWIRKWRGSSETVPENPEGVQLREGLKQEVLGLVPRLFPNEFDEKLRLFSFKRHWRDEMPKLAEFLASDFDSFDLQYISVLKQEIGSAQKIIIDLAFEDPDRPLKIPIAKVSFDFNPALEISSSMTTEFGLEYRVTRGSDKKDPYTDAHRLSMVVEVMNYIIGERDLINDRKPEPATNS